MIYLPFLVEKYPKLRRKYEIIASIQLTAQVLWTLRYIYFLTNTDDDLLNLYLADANYMLGPARRPMNLLFALINFASLNAMILTKYSPKLQPGQHHHWLRDCEVFETEYFKGLGKFTSELKLLYWLKYGLIVLIVIICIAADVKYFSITPKEYFIFGIFFFFHHAFDAAIIMSYLINLLALFVFHMYLYARYFNHLANSNQSGSQLGMNYFVSHKHLIELYGFYKKSLLSTLIVFTSGQVLMIYYIFFSTIDQSIKLSLTSILVVAHLYGIGGIFLIGAYIRNKVCNRKCKSIHRMDKLNFIRSS